MAEDDYLNMAFILNYKKNGKNGFYIFKCNKTTKKPMIFQYLIIFVYVW